MISRRGFLKSLVGLAVTATLPAVNVLPTEELTTVSAVTTVAPELFINIRDFGAVGDGVTDVTAALQTAIQMASISGKNVYLPSGDYRILSPIFNKMLH